MTDALLTMDHLAARLGKHPKTARRLLFEIMAWNPGLRVTKVGRSILFTESQFGVVVASLNRSAMPIRPTPYEPKPLKPRLNPGRRGWENIPKDYVFAHPDELRDEHTIILSARDHRVSGIYFLVRDNRVVYVGISLNVFSRVEEHRRAGRNFDRWHYEVCDYERAVALESAYIAKLKPAMNLKGISGV